MGEMGMMFDYYYSLTPRQFNNALIGYRNKENLLSQERWLIARKVIFYNVLCHAEKPPLEQELFPLPWDVAPVDMTEAETAKMLEDLEQQKEFWKRFDEQQLTKKAEGI
jgi:hypothetical protein